MEPLLPHLAHLARALLAAVFIYSAVHKALHWQAGIAEVRALKLPLPPLALASTVVLQGLCGVMLFAGWYSALAAAALAAFTLVASLVAHPFWRADAGPQHMTFLEHLAIVGGLLFVASHG